MGSFSTKVVKLQDTIAQQDVKIRELEAAVKEKEEIVCQLKVEHLAVLAMSEEKTKAAVVEFKKSDEMQHMLEEKGKAAVKDFKESEVMQLISDYKKANSCQVQAKSMMFQVLELIFLIAIFQNLCLCTCVITGFLNYWCY